MASAPIANDPSSLADLNARLDAVTAALRGGDGARVGREITAIRAELDRLPPSAGRAALRGRLDVERARHCWLGLGTDPSFDLAGAMKVAVSTRLELGALVDTSLQADIASVVAGIAYDLGDGASLEEAREVVRAAIVDLMKSETVLEPAALLCDEAALELRMGHLDRAIDLLDYARRALVVENEVTPTIASRCALAGTHHLIARVALRRRAREGLGVNVADARGHAQLAERAYRELGRHRDVGRVIETQARLSLLEGQVDDAGALFIIALSLADGSVDVVGLARAAAGLAEVLTAKGDIPAALGLLESSIELNRRKGSPGGLAYDEELLAEIDRAAVRVAAIDPTVPRRLAEVRKRLEQALAPGQ